MANEPITLSFHEKNCINVYNFLNGEKNIQRARLWILNIPNGAYGDYLKNYNTIFLKNFRSSNLIFKSNSIKKREKRGKKQDNILLLYKIRF